MNLRRLSNILLHNDLCPHSNKNIWLIGECNRARIREKTIIWEVSKLLHITTIIEIYLYDSINELVNEAQGKTGSRANHKYAAPRRNLEI